MALTKQKVKNFCSFARQKWVKHRRCLSMFRKYEQSWLDIETEFSVLEKERKKGRPHVDYSDGSERHKRKLASNLSSQQENNAMLLVHAASISAQSSKNNDLKYVLKEAAASPSRPSKIRKRLTVDLKTPLPLSPEEALAFLVENDLTKQQYINMRDLNKARNCDIYPAYYKLLECKSKCRPEGIIATDISVKVPLQNMVDHIANRIILRQQDVLSQMQTISDASLILSYGFDGSTGHSLFKQQFKETTPETLDHSLFITSIIPLKLISSEDKIIWLNQTPQSIRFCRPLKIEFVKESKEHITNENNSLNKEISELKPFEYILNDDKKITVTYKLFMTLIDGKVLNVLTETKSSQSCAICGATPKQFMATKDLNSKVFQPKPNTLKYGISPLHAWIRCFEFVLHVAYRKDLKKWQIRNDEEKEILKQCKAEIQKKMWELMSLHVDKPKSNGSGNTNDGNTARKAFSNTELFAFITGIDIRFLDRLFTILVSISCEYEVDAKKFKDFCEETAKLYLKEYDWYPMSATLHKILIHGSQILEAAVLPLGFLAENASEARNKFYKKDRIAHARKDSRVHNMIDVYGRAMDSSDPLLSSLCLQNRIKSRHRMQLPSAVIDLLKIPDVPSNSELPSTSRACLRDFSYDSDDSVPSLTDYPFELDVDEILENFEGKH